MSNEILFAVVILLIIADIAAAVFLSKKFDKRADSRELALFLQGKLGEQNEKFTKEIGELKLVLQKNENEKNEELSRKLFGFFETSNKT